MHGPYCRLFAVSCGAAVESRWMPVRNRRMQEFHDATISSCSSWPVTSNPVSQSVSQCRFRFYAKRVPTRATKRCMRQNRTGLRTMGSEIARDNTSVFLYTSGAWARWRCQTRVDCQR